MAYSSPMVIWITIASESAVIQSGEARRVVGYNESKVSGRSCERNSGDHTKAQSRQLRSIPSSRPGDVELFLLNLQRQK